MTVRDGSGEEGRILASHGWVPTDDNKLHMEMMLFSNSTFGPFTWPFRYVLLRWTNQVAVPPWRARQAFVLSA